MNPLQMISQIISNPNISNNPVMSNAIGMYQRNDAKGLEQLASNLCKERGIDINELRNRVTNQFKI